MDHNRARMRPAAGLGLLAAALVVAAGAAAGLYVWKRPLAVAAMFDRRSLAGAGLTETTASTGFGPQNYWTGGQGQTLVLLHGAGGHAGSWAPVVATLAPRYRLVIPDLAGHGPSAPTDGPISVGLVVRGIEAILSQGPQDPVILVGHSLGAWVALLYAREYPGRVARVILVNGGALDGDGGDLRSPPATRPEAAALMSLMRDPGAAPVPGYVLDNLVREALRGPTARLVRSAAEVEQFGLAGRLGEVAAPVNLLWGQSDRLLPLAYASRMMADLRASRLTTFPACGHVPHQECPARFRAALLDTLQQPPPSPDR